MPLPSAIAPHATALARIVASLLAMLGVAPPARIAIALHAAIARTLRPAESAVRRIILFLAKGIRQRPHPPRAMPAGLVRTAPGNPIPSFCLFDPRPRIFQQRRAKSPNLQPRITFFGADGAHTVSFVPPPREPGDGLLNAKHLLNRLRALDAALKTLPRQARRLLRAMARNQARRRRMAGPLRPGRAPGWRQRPREEVDSILRECDWLAREALWDTS